MTASPRRSPRSRALRHTARAVALALVGVALPSIASAAPSISAAPAACTSRTPRDRPDHPDMGIVRFRDPSCRRDVWLGADVGGVVLPKNLGPLDRTVWTVRAGPAWAIRLAPWLSAGGRHGIAIYDAGDVRLRVHDHQVELAAHPMRDRRATMHDRLSAGIETHAVLAQRIDGRQFRLGGVRDLVAYVGYGIDHTVAPRWRLGWQAHFRHAWLFHDTQRQLRLGVRLAFTPRPAHRLSVAALGFLVDRNPDQAGRPMPRRTVVGQVAAEYAWMSRVGIGPSLQVRYSTGFLTGEAPVYELRSEVLHADYADATIGLRAVW